jgi:hypothetical protein
MPATERPLRAVLAAGIKQARQRQGLRQEDAATKARAYGLSSWIRGTVAQAEVGARRFALEEVLLLALAYETSLAELVAGDANELVELTPDARLSVGALRALLSGNGEHVRELPAEAVDVPVRRGTVPRRVSRFPDVLAEAERFGIGDRSQLAGAADVSDAERHAGRKLGTTPERITIAALRLWGRTLTAERDHRLSEQAADLSARSRQALRGHITRDLMTELRAELGDQENT